MKVEINRTIDSTTVSLYSHRTGKFIDDIPADAIKDLVHLRGGSSV